MQNNLAEDYSKQPEILVARIQDGQNELRESFIDSYHTYIACIVSRMIHVTAYGRDEYSVALEAFNEAVNRYDISKGASFLTFAELVINRRVIDFIRKNCRHSNEYPFTYFEVNDKDDTLNQILDERPSMLLENIEIKEELLEFQKQLMAYGIRISDLEQCSPHHLDTKQMCIAMAKKISASPELCFKLQSTRRLPAGDMAKEFGVSRKTMDKHRKYIIAIFVILKSNLETIKSYIDFLPDRGN